MKTTLCPKEVFPYGVNKCETYYNPTCIENILECKDICGKKCQNSCKKDHAGCTRGKLSTDFLFCPMQEIQPSTKLAYIKYELATEEHAKEGKAAYKKMEKVYYNLPVDDLMNIYIDDFAAYSKHKVESWYLNAVRNAAMSKEYMPSHAMSMVIDFAQNLVLEKQHAISEEYFHKKQVALTATVTKVCTPIQSELGSENSTVTVEHVLSQITSSENKY